MMKKWVLLAALVAMTSGAVPSLRDRAEPVLSYGISGFDTAVSWFADSVFRWSVNNELTTILDRLEKHAATGEPLPRPDGFPAFLRRNRMAGSIDPWGAAYYLEVRAETVVVGSAGPDGERGTDDDLTATRSIM